MVLTAVRLKIDIEKRELWIVLPFALQSCSLGLRHNAVTCSVLLLASIPECPSHSDIHSGLPSANGCRTNGPSLSGLLRDDISNGLPALNRLCRVSDQIVGDMHNIPSGFSAKTLEVLTAVR